ncbi:MAG: pro-sigmaK processing inhibitor BofA family protein [Bacilli bacterium]|nr:pro-sigmaK processing inhibitor BofA family protein [Bacilli bacterium]MDD4406595.1 pro-sigmaK processing inhibitor BofA family protein [Bacilli bacterium]
MIFKIIKRIVFAIVIIYSLDLFIRNLDIFIPLNIYTISAVSVLGFPGLITLALSFFFLL